MNAHANNAAHTPGPWVADDGGEGSYYGIFSDTEAVAYLCESRRQYGEIALPYAGGGETNWEQHRANARLIAAAPELLEALRNSPCSCADGDGNSITCDRCAAIAKATGGAK